MVWRITRWAERLFDLAFVGLAALWGVLFLLDKLGAVPLSAPVGVLMMAVWCPLFYWKYWRSKAALERGAWFELACSVVLTGLTVFAAFVILIRIVRS